MLYSHSLGIPLICHHIAQAGVLQGQVIVYGNASRAADSDGEAGRVVTTLGLFGRFSRWQWVDAAVGNLHKICVN